MENEEEVKQEEEIKEPEVKEGIEEEERKPAEDLKGEAPPEPELQKPWYQDNGFTFKSEEDAIKSMKELRGYSTKTAQDLALAKNSLDMYGKYIRGELTLEEGQTIESYVAGENDRYLQEEKERISQLESDAKMIEQSIGVMKRLYPKIYTDDNLPILNVLAYQSEKNTPLERMEDAAEMYKEKFGHLSKKEKEDIVTEQERMKAEANLEGPGGRGKPSDETESAWDLSTEDFRKRMENVTYRQ